MDTKLTPERILQNINALIDQEGLRKERLAKKMGKQLSSFYATLSGKHPNAVYKFAIELAELLGYKPNHFLDEEFDLPSEPQQTNRFAFSVGSVTEKAREGLEEIEKICDLIRIYDTKGDERYA